MEMSNCFDRNHIFSQFRPRPCKYFITTNSVALLVNYSATSLSSEKVLYIGTNKRLQLSDKFLFNQKFLITIITLACIFETFSNPKKKI